MSGSQTLRVRLVRSPIGFSKRQKDTVRSLGFTKLQQVKTLPDNGAVRGMIAAVGHLVQLEQDPAGQKGGDA